MLNEQKTAKKLLNKKRKLANALQDNIKRRKTIAKSTVAKT